MIMNKKSNKTGEDYTVALLGNPNVGKSTVFNSLTGLKQHTGNWPGKTVGSAFGYYKINGSTVKLADLPGTYSLKSSSPEEEITRDYICFSDASKIIVVCDATCLERNLNLLLQVCEMRKGVTVAINLCDEAKKKNIKIDPDKLSSILKCPIVTTSARNGKGLDKLIRTVDADGSNDFYNIKYPKEIEKYIKSLCEVLDKNVHSNLSNRWIAVKILENNVDFVKKLFDYLIISDDVIGEIEEIRIDAEHNIGIKTLEDFSAACTILSAEYIYGETVEKQTEKSYRRNDNIDKILTGKLTGVPIMLIMLFFIFWLTISGANYPSELLSKLLFYIEDKLFILFDYLKVPPFITGMLVEGGYRVLAWVVSVMLPPMMIFFPLFTLLEDLGYLPRVAFNLDYRFKKAESCGRQSLTMCMGFGCNAAGVTGCRIIESERERLIAIITNSLVPCNGRFPILISLISMFFIVSQNGLISSVTSTLILLGIIVLGIIMTFISSKILSKTVLKGVPSSFALELPPYRKPQIGKVIIRSVFDRTIFVLSRAMIVSFPAGIVIWLLSNCTINGNSIITIISDFLNTPAAIIGLDGTILLAFILGSPANEIVLPIMLMIYSNATSLHNFSGNAVIKSLLITNGWTVATALSVMIFTLFHWPCTTTALTVKKETGSIKWTLISILLPTLEGIIFCLIINIIKTIVR